MKGFLPAQVVALAIGCDTLRQNGLPIMDDGILPRLDNRKK